MCTSKSVPSSPSLHVPYSGSTGYQPCPTLASKGGNSVGVFLGIVPGVSTQEHFS